MAGAITSPETPVAAMAASKVLSPLDDRRFRDPRRFQRSLRQLRLAGSPDMPPNDEDAGAASNSVEDDRIAAVVRRFEAILDGKTASKNTKAKLT